MASSSEKRERPETPSRVPPRLWLRKAIVFLGMRPTWCLAGAVTIAAVILLVVVVHVFWAVGASRPDGSATLSEPLDQTTAFWDSGERKAFPRRPSEADRFGKSGALNEEELRRALQEMQRKIAGIERARGEDGGLEPKARLERAAGESSPSLVPNLIGGGGKPAAGKPLDGEGTLSSQQVFERCAPMVVCICVKGADKDGHKAAEKVGSGFFVSSDGLLITNYHVIERGLSAYVHLSDGKQKKVLGVVATDPAGDLALLQIAGGPHPHLLLETDPRGVPAVGDKVFAIGNPEGFTNTLSEGIVSGFRDIEGVRLLQTTAPISHGSSGGPLLNTCGKVVGVTTGSWSRGQNLNFALALGQIRSLMGSKGPIEDLAVAASKPGPLTRQREAIKAIDEARRTEARKKAEEARRQAEAEQRAREQEKRQQEAVLALKQELASVTTQLEHAKAEGRAAVDLRNRMERQYKSEHAAVETRYSALVEQIQKAYRRELAALILPRPPLLAPPGSPERVQYRREMEAYRRRLQEVQRRRSERLLAAQGSRTDQHRGIEQRCQPQVVAIDSKLTQLAETVKALTRKQAELQAQLGSK